VTISREAIQVEEREKETIIEFNSKSAERVKYKFELASEQHPSVADYPSLHEPTSQRSANAALLIVSTKGFLDAYCL
jgi:hypothetical protein